MSLPRYASGLIEYTSCHSETLVDHYLTFRCICHNLYFIRIKVLKRHGRRNSRYHNICI